ncbi:MAG: hypothetical protein ACXWF8_16080 [Methylobacter sp.]
MDWWILKQLRAMLLMDLRDFVPQDYFESEVETFKFDDRIPNSEHFSHELRWGYLAARLGQKLFFKSTIIMSARQVSASEVLMNLGMLASAEAAHGATTQVSNYAEAIGVSDGNAGAVAKQLREQHIPTLSDNVREGLKQYLRYLTPIEAEPFLPLLDSLSSPQDQGNYPMTHNYNFYGNVGSVQTGDSTTANIIQNLSINERASLAAALQQFKETIESAPSLTEPQRQELLKVVQKCYSQIDNESSSDSTLLDAFNILGIAIQSISSAQPAYQALKTAFLALGIALP